MDTFDLITSKKTHCLLQWNNNPTLHISSNSMLAIMSVQDQSRVRLWSQIRGARLRTAGSCERRDTNTSRGSSADAGGQVGRRREDEGLKEMWKKRRRERRSSGHQHTDRSMPVMIAQSQPPPPQRQAAFYYPSAPALCLTTPLHTHTHPTLSPEGPYHSLDKGQSNTGGLCKHEIWDGYLNCTCIHCVR